MTQIPHLPDVLPRLRERLRARVLATSLGTVASEVGMSPTGLQQFISNDSTPYRKTADRLLLQWIKNGAGDGELLEARRFAIELATGHVPAPLGARAAALVLELLEGVTEERLDGMERVLRGQYER